VTEKQQHPPASSSSPTARIDGAAPGESDPVTEGRVAEARAVVATRGSTPATPAPEQSQYVGLVTRAIAFTFDAVVINFVALVVTAGNALILTLVHLPKQVVAVILAIGGVVYVLWNIGYFVVFWSNSGQTPGNAVMRIRVVAADGGKLPPRRGLLRYGALLLAALPLFAGFISVLYDPRCRAFQDYMARTVVIDAPVPSPADQWRLRHGQPPAAAANRIVVHSPNGVPRS
jgi:uncharacterized RDD family membrane protein YckC